jgi:uncharacterized damage-inducible protein DinB
MSDQQESGKQEPEQIVSQYAVGAEELDTALAGLSESDLDLCRQPGKWSIRQIVHHIVDTEDIWKTGIKAAMGNSGCAFNFDWYIDNNICAGPLDYAHRPVSPAVEFFRASRRSVVELVTHLSDDWDRHLYFYRDTLPGPKEFSIIEILQWLILHLQMHLEQILETRKVHGK